MYDGRSSQDRTKENRHEPLGDTDPVFGEELGKLFGVPFDLLLGRRTYDIFAAY